MFVKIIYRHFVFNQEKYQVCKFRIYRHFVKSVNGSNFPVQLGSIKLLKLYDFLRKSKIGFLSPKESENGFCVSLLNRSIQDLSDHDASKEPKNPV